MARLKFVALSGTTGVTENLYVYEYGDDMIVVDCGVGFPESEMHGVDLVIPDFGYIVRNKKKLRGIVITHGHEDHLGAVPFLLREVKAPVYGTRLTAGFIEDKLRDYDMPVSAVKVFNPDSDKLKLGRFTVQGFRVSHSVPDTIGLAIDTPEGRVFHVADYKFDWAPVDGRPFDVGKAAILAKDGVLALASDSLGSTSVGYTQSESAIEPKIEAIIREAKGQVYFTTISSNISRMQQAIWVAERLGRKVAFVGRSIQKKADIAEGLGLLEYPKGVVVDLRDAKRLHKDKVVYIVAGSYGQPGSALYRVSMNEHKHVGIDPGDTVIFSGDPAPPGSKTNVDALVDQLFDIGVDVHYYDLQEDLHVSGHGSIQDIMMLFGIVKPKYFIPIGGTVRHMRGYSLLAQKMGAKESQVFELMPGDSIEFGRGEAKKGESIIVHEALLDGLEVGDVGNVVLRDRNVLAKEGVVVAIAQFDRNTRKIPGTPDLISRGFVFEKVKKDFLIKSGEKMMNSLNKRQIRKPHILKSEIIGYLENYFYQETGRRPMILPVVVEV